MNMTSGVFTYLISVERNKGSESVNNASKVLALQDTGCGISLHCCSPKDSTHFPTNTRTDTSSVPLLGERAEIKAGSLAKKGSGV